MSFDLLNRPSLHAGQLPVPPRCRSVCPEIARAQTNVIIGIVYVGPKDDFGWNQAHAVNIGAR